MDASIVLKYEAKKSSLGSKIALWDSSICATAISFCIVANFIKEKDTI
jgi:hypothetical protein